MKIDAKTRAKLEEMLKVWDEQAVKLQSYQGRRAYRRCAGDLRFILNPGPTCRADHKGRACTCTPFCL